MTVGRMRCTKPLRLAFASAPGSSACRSSCAWWRVAPAGFAQWRNASSISPVRVSAVLNMFFVCWWRWISVPGWWPTCAGAGSHIPSRPLPRRVLCRAPPCPCCLQASSLCGSPSTPNLCTPSGFWCKTLPYPPPPCLAALAPADHHKFPRNFHFDRIHLRCCHLRSSPC